MLRRLKLSIICFALGFSVLLFSFIRYFVNDQSSIGKQFNILNVEESQKIQELLQIEELVEKLLEKTRFKIKSELRGYNFTLSGVRGLDNLSFASGGQSLHSVVISTWRSGSTFLGEILNAMPANYYHYEPFFEHKFQIRGPPNADKAIKMVTNLLKCEFKDMDEYFEYRKIDLNQFKQNTRLWELCKANVNLCFDNYIMSRVCKLYPFQSMKLVRYRLNLMRDILEDPELNVRVVLLIRDPRGVMQSRRHLHFCQRAPHCRESKELCADMVSDYIAAKQLIRLYPNRLKIVRYEELALNPVRKSHEVYEFLKLGGFKSVDEFLYSHTNVEVEGVTSTYRITRNIPFKWKDLLPFQDVVEIQTACSDAMRLWGYRMVKNATHMRSPEFYPVKNYSIV